MGKVVKALAVLASFGGITVLGEQALMHQDALAGALVICLLVGVTLMVMCD